MCVLVSCDAGDDMQRGLDRGTGGGQRGKRKKREKGRLRTGCYLARSRLYVRPVPLWSGDTGGDTGGDTTT